MAGVEGGVSVVQPPAPLPDCPKGVVRLAEDGEVPRREIEVVYEAHAATADNEAGIATGRLPGTLSATGRVQARERNHRPVSPPTSADIPPPPAANTECLFSITVSELSALDMTQAT
ncbi:hypothetical protein OG830_32040 [Streptomyces sp. NBC_00121]|uniref:hypothetical protein n=1 Tax=unclassified Streptomyces TaxID=2593676 RepID=UPI002DD948E5|nr:hypothetical protein [Streptomyces sp. NBC_01760]WSC72863.1 hypothetical protein OG807_32700 [Streptomyces sp. NBC_01760]WTI90591.1 hypothetical protein OHB17_32645 [Streptomyces sp. NBC_00724]